jgi:hypothetical protein
MRDDPCFRCSLPDCDDRDRGCEVRKLQRSYYSKVRYGHHDQITDQERVANNRIFDTWHLERLAEDSEGGRPYLRGRRGSAVQA